MAEPRTVTSETKGLINDLHLLPKHFTDTGVIQRLVALLTEKDLALEATEAALDEMLKHVTLDVAVRAAKAAAGLDPAGKHLPMEFIEHLPTRLHKQFWQSAVDRVLNSIDAETESS